MFRDLKEYQQIQKIYEERVCISEEDRYITKELEETFTEDEINFIAENTEEVFAEISNQLVEEGSDITEETIDEMAKVVAKALPLAQRMAAGFAKNVAKKAPVAGGIAKKTASGGGGLMKKAGGLVKKGVGFVKKNVGKIAGAVGVGGAAAGAAIATKGKPEKKMSNIPVIDGPVNNPEYGKNMSRDEKDLNPPKPEVKTPDPKPSFKDKFIKKDKGVGFVKRGTPMAQRAENKEKNKMRAQEMAKARIAAKKEGTASPQMSAADRAKAMAKARLAKKASMEEYTPYDYVLEYLLSSEQAATIEEANYVMTEMDAETIQGIVEEQKKNLMKE